MGQTGSNDTPDSGTRPFDAVRWQQERRQRGRARIPALTLLAHPNPSRVGERTALSLLAAGREALLSRSQPGFALPGTTTFRSLDDPWLSRTPLRLTRGPE